MRSLLEVEVPPGGPSPVPAAGAPVMPQVDFRGRLPKQLANFLGRLSIAQRQDVYAVKGTFLEVRVLVGTARLLDCFLREAPHAAARGRMTIGEFMAEKERLLGDIQTLREKVNRSAANICRFLPRVPQLRRKDDFDDDVPPLRVS